MVMDETRDERHPLLPFFATCPPSLVLSLSLARKQIGQRTHEWCTTNIHRKQKRYVPPLPSHKSQMQIARSRPKHL